MPDKSLFKKALGWFRVVLFAADTISDILVINEVYNLCLYVAAHTALGVFLWSGAWSGGFLTQSFGKKVLEEKYGHSNGYCGKIILFLLGATFSPLIFIPAGIYLLAKAAIDPDNNSLVKDAKW